MRNLFLFVFAVLIQLSLYLTFVFTFVAVMTVFVNRNPALILNFNRLMDSFGLGMPDYLLAALHGQVAPGPHKGDVSIWS